LILIFLDTNNDTLIPGIPDGPVIMLVKVKDALMADALEEKLNEAMK
jgi:hypothetical protein